MIYIYTLQKHLVTLESPKKALSITGSDFGIYQSKCLPIHLFLMTLERCKVGVFMVKNLLASYMCTTNNHRIPVQISTNWSELVVHLYVWDTSCPCFMSSSGWFMRNPHPGRSIPKIFISHQFLKHWHSFCMSINSAPKKTKRFPQLLL